MLDKAMAAAIGAITSFIVGWLRDIWRDRRDAKFSALYLAIALDAYVHACATVVRDSKAHDDTDGHQGTFHGNIPKLPEFPATIEWKPLGIELATAAMSFRCEVDATAENIDEFWDVLCDEDECLPYFWEKACLLGQDAFRLAGQLLKEKRIPASDYLRPDDDRAYLENTLNKLIANRKRWEEQSRQMHQVL